MYGCCGVTEKKPLAEFVKESCKKYNSSFDAPGIPLVHRLGWKTIEELIAHESKLMVFKSLNLHYILG